MPLVQALSEKGVVLGTVLAFMMAVVAISLPEMILLRRVLKPKLLAAFVGVVGTGILAVGYLFDPYYESKERTMKIEVLGSGCANCIALEVATGQALAQFGMDQPVEKITDFPTIVSYGVMSTPALALDGEVKVAGRIPNVEELKRLLSEHSLSHLG